MNESDKHFRVNNPPSTIQLSIKYKYGSYSDLWEYENSMVLEMVINCIAYENDETTIGYQYKTKFCTNLGDLSKLLTSLENKKEFESEIGINGMKWQAQTYRKDESYIHFTIIEFNEGPTNHFSEIVDSKHEFYLRRLIFIDELKRFLSSVKAELCIDKDQ